MESELVVSALCNLIRNAAEALHEPNQVSLVQIEAGSDELPILHRDGRLLARPAVRFRVQDNGPGIPEDRADRIFNRSTPRDLRARVLGWPLCTSSFSLTRAMCVCCPMAKNSGGAIFEIHCRFPAEGILMAQFL